MADFDFKEKFDDFKDDAIDTFGDFKEEAGEVFQEARAAARGERLDSADTVGGAGYRETAPVSKGKAVAALVLGIVSIVFSFFGYSAIIGIILAIIGLVFGTKARKQAQTGLATAGFVLSLIGLIANSIGIICAIACVSGLAAAGYSY